MPKPAETARYCEKCGARRPDVMFDPIVHLWLCHWCWLVTPPESPQRRFPPLEP